MNQRLRRTVVVLLITSFLTTVAFAQTARESFDLLSGVVIDTASSVAFVMNPGGGSDAVDLASGEVRWHSDQAGRPLALIDNKLVAQVEATQAGQLDVVVLEATSGSLLRTATTTLPADTVARVDDALGTSFRSWARIDGADLAIGWDASRQLIKGTGFGPLHKTTSAVSLKPDAGTVAPIKAVPTPRKSQPELQGSAKLAGIAGRHFFSADSRHLLASEPLTDRWGYRWQLFTPDGTPLGEVTSLTAYAPFFVAGSVVVYIVQPEMHRVGDKFVVNPLMLRAVDLYTGEEAWIREIRDTTYRGPIPP